MTNKKPTKPQKAHRKAVSKATNAPPPPTTIEYDKRLADLKRRLNAVSDAYEAIPASQPLRAKQPAGNLTKAPPPPSPVSGSGPSGPIKPQVSKAGPVPTRIGSGMLVSQRTADALERASRERDRREAQIRALNRPVIWSKWRLVLQLKVWEFVALSLDIDPDKVKHSPDGWMADAHLFEESQEFNDRVFVLCRHFGWRGGELSADARKDRSEFVQFALSVEWEIPDDLATLGHPPTIEDNDRGVASGSRKNGLRRIIDNIVARKPDITEKDLLRELQALVKKPTDGVTIERITDAKIEWRDNKQPAGTNLISGLKDILSRSKRDFRAKVSATRE